MKKNTLIFAVFTFFLSIIFACSKDDIVEQVVINEDKNSNTQRPVTLQYLGELLFYDPILSGHKDVACATCHHPSFGFADGLDLSIGVNAVGLGPKRQFLSNTFPPTKRKSMTILNTAFNGMDEEGKFDPTNAPMFWDSRAKSLEEQALIPIKSDVEMRGNAYSEAVAIDSVLARLRNITEYRTLFATVFEGQVQPITASNLAKAIATFERSLVAMESPYDRHLRGEVDAMTELEIQGLNAFQANGCGKCHSGKMFSDYKLHVLSVPDNPKSAKSDDGANGTYAFRTMSLRNLKLTSPYMHSGVFQTLEEVIDFYNKILDENSQNPNVPSSKIDSLANNLRTTNQKAAIVAFLKSLNSGFEVSIPKSVPSKLNVGGNIK